MAGRKLKHCDEEIDVSVLLASSYQMAQYVTATVLDQTTIYTKFTYKRP